MLGYGDRGKDVRDLIPVGVLCARVERLRGRLEKNGLDAVFINAPSTDLHYFLGIRRGTTSPSDDEKFGDWLHGAVIPVEGKVQVIGPRMGAGPALTQALEGTPWVDGLRVAGDGILSTYVDPADAVRSAFAAAGSPKRVGIAGTMWSRRLFALQRAVPDVVVQDAEPVLSGMRAVKDEHEIAAMSRAAALTERAFAAVLPQLAVGLTEQEIATELDRLFIVFGAEGSAFPSGVRVTGPSVESRPVVGRRNGNTPIQPNTSLTFDMGCVVDGYASDFGRTVFWDEPGQESLERLDLVMQSRSACVSAMRGGAVTASELSRIARKPIEDAGYEEVLLTWVGHGIGLDVHERPMIRPGDETVLETGMCLAVEPSCRVPGAPGVRVEDVILVTPEGGNSLHTFSREPLIMGG